MLDSVIVCDDSRFARQQLIRSLPAGLSRDILTASHGEEALQLLRQGHGELLFLDLTMPGIDGYQVLETIRNEQLNTLVIVVSGDIQVQAHRRILSLGALAFLQKPLQQEQLLTTLRQCGVFNASMDHRVHVVSRPTEEKIGYEESLQEIINIAMGQAARQLAELLNLFIDLPIPQVTLISTAQLQQKMEQWLEEEGNMVVSQGFIGSSISGECLIHFLQDDISRIAPLLGFDEEVGEDRQSLLIELSSMLSGTLLLGLSDLLGLRFSRSHPALVNTSETSLLNQQQPQQALSVSLAYTIPSQQIQCSLLLLFTDASLSPLQRRLSLITE